MKILGGAALPPVELLHSGPTLAAPSPELRVVEGGLLRVGRDPLLVPRPGSLRVAVGPRGALLAHTLDTGTRLEWLRGDTIAHVRDLPGAVLALGSDVVIWSGGGAVHVETADGRAWPVPEGARVRNACPAPWGLCWTEGRTLFRWRPDRGASVAATLPAATGRLWTGPGGMVLADTRKGAVLCVPGQGPVPVEGLSGRITAADLSVDVVIEDEDGVALIEDGEVIDRRESGRVGCEGRWLDEAGDLRAWDEEDDVPAPGAAVVFQGALHGPGGLAWDLDDGQPVGVALSSGAELALGGSELGVLVLEDDELCMVIPPTDAAPDGSRLLQARVPDGALPLALELHAGRWVLQTDQGAFREDLHRGLVRCDLPPREPPPLPALAAALPLSLDGAHAAPDGSLWAWQELGLLLRIGATR
ncbi:MAG: hypothetical protein H6742_06020 [Alphaproteobacteria bacterium]|nr:hypothetical protein [Alphaproteobacteria bacterium]